MEKESVCFLKWFSCEIRSLLSIKYKKIGERMKPCPTPIFTLKRGKTKSFYKYWVFLLIK